MTMHTYLPTYSTYFSQTNAMQERKIMPTFIGGATKLGIDNFLVVFAYFYIQYFLLGGQIGCTLEKIRITK